MNEQLIRDAEWSHLMHPADADALAELRNDRIISLLSMINALGLAVIAASVSAWWWLG